VSLTLIVLTDLKFTKAVGKPAIFFQTASNGIKWRPRVETEPAVPKSLMEGVRSSGRARLVYFFFDEDFFLDEDFFFGTLPPAFRASDRPIAIACFLLVTFFPERPLLSVPFFRSCIAFSTFSDAFLPYLAMAILSSPVFGLAV